MGEPLDEKQAKVFNERTVVKSLELAPAYKWRENIKVRDEGWGVIVFNPRNQSFTVLSPEFREYMTKKEGFVVGSHKVIKTLLAFGAIREARESGQEAPILLNQVRVLPASDMLPRLAESLDCSNEVHCLRADTGERYFF